MRHAKTFRLVKILEQNDDDEEEEEEVKKRLFCLCDGARLSLAKWIRRSKFIGHSVHMRTSISSISHCLCKFNIIANLICYFFESISKDLNKEKALMRLLSDSSEAQMNKSIN